MDEVTRRIVSEVLCSTAEQLPAVLAAKVLRGEVSLGQAGSVAAAMSKVGKELRDIGEALRDDRLLIVPPEVRS